MTKPIRTTSIAPPLASRRSVLARGLLGCASMVHPIALSWISASSGCAPSQPGSKEDRPDLIIGQRGLADGRFQKPRALAIDASDVLFAVDKTGRVQSFDSKGNFIRGWRTPEIEHGKPTGISIDQDGTVIVADTHYFRFLFYTPSGQLMSEKTIGGVNGPEPGQFAFVTDIVRMPSGEFIVGEYGEFDRVHKYSSEGKFIDRFGEHGTESLQFSRPQSIAVDDHGFIWIADACNHRIQVVDWTGSRPKLVRMIGDEGNGPGQFKYPYSITLSENHLIVSEYGNHRVQKLKLDGTFVQSWGSVGSQPGQLIQPWAVSADSRGRIYVVDSGNNRIQRFRF